ncbi:MAG: hypothetical protein E7218_02190 [Anaerofustis stercorihominis]|nr:hypothetical protein [Anaerofustis stercorihominis]
MNIYIPNYYNNFRCIADKCTHNCCIGWEIDIDAQTLEKYRTHEGVLSERIKKCITADGDTASFILTEDERCPFLNKNNLCDIFTHMGEDSLCQICTDHPRFRNFFTDRTEIGLGLSCEEAARVILTNKDKFTLLSDGDMDKEDFTFEEIELIFRRNDMIDILTDREKNISDRIKKLLLYNNCSLPDISFTQWADFMYSLEILDESWKNYIAVLYECDNDDMLTFPTEYEMMTEQLIVYFLYRHLAGSLDDGCFYERVLFCVISTIIINAICKAVSERQKAFSENDYIEICRLYSQEIEYSEDNTEAFIDEIYEYINS